MSIVRRFLCNGDKKGNPAETNVTEDGGRYGRTFWYSTPRDGTLYAMLHFDVIPTSIQTVMQTLYRESRIRKFALEPVR